jgi:type IV pilus biogenesis protein CpaD/CtpE
VTKRRKILRKITLAALTLTVLAGCASTDTVQTASRDDSYTPLGSYLPRKKTADKDDRTYVDKEEFKRQQEMSRPDSSTKN